MYVYVSVWCSAHRAMDDKDGWQEKESEKSVQ